MSGLVEVWDSANATKLADLRTDDGTRLWAPTSARVQERVAAGDNGKGSVRIPHGHPASSHLTYRNVVRVLDDTAVRGAFTVGEVDWVEVAKSPESQKGITASGPGLLDRWNDMIVLPWVPIDQKPVSLTRVFNWSSPGLDTSGWSSTIYQQERSWADPSRPIAMPEPVSAWIYGREEGPSHPVEEWAFRREFTLTGDADVAFFKSADDRFRAFCDGAELMTQDPEFPSDVWWWTWRSGVRLPAGDHLYAIAVRNDGGPGAMVSSAWTSDGTGMIGPPVFVTGADEGNPYIGEWLCALLDGTVGWTVGAILRTLLEEAQARGAMLDVTLGFDDDTDSDGAPWEIIPEVAFRVGTRGGAVLASLEAWAEFGIDLTVDGIRTLAWNRGGRGGPSGVTLTEGDNLAHLAHRGRA